MAGVLKLSQKQYLTTRQRSYSDDAVYRVPVVGDIDLPAIAKALAKGFKPESGYGRLRWSSTPPSVEVDFGPQPLVGGTVLVVYSTSICD